MKKNISEWDFIEAFKLMDRGEQYTPEALIALYEYFAELEKSCDIDIELDVIAICCEYTEYADFDEIKDNYYELEDMDDLKNRTQVIEFEGGIIIQDF